MSPSKMTPPDYSDPDDSPMTGRYLAALALEAVIIALLYLLGRMYS